jgi:hypothetical protein
MHIMGQRLVSRSVDLRAGEPGWTTAPAVWLRCSESAGCDTQAQLVPRLFIQFDARSGEVLG